MGRGAIPSRRGFSRGAMRHPGVSGITRPFGRLSRGRGQVLHVLLSRSPLASARRQVPFDLHVLGAPPAFILSQDRTLRPKYMGFEPVRSSQLLADRFRSIHMVLLDRKRNFSGPPLGGLAKNKSKLDHFKWFDVCPDATQLVCPSSQYPVLKVHAVRLIRLHRAARQGDILPDRRGRVGGNPVLHILFTNKSRGPGIRQGLIDDHKSQTDRMTSVFLLSDVDVSLIYPNQNVIAPRRRIATISPY